MGVNYKKIPVEKMNFKVKKKPGLTLEEEDTLLLAFSVVTFHSCIQWGWDARKLILEQLWIFFLLLRRVYPDFVPLHTKALCF